MSDNRLTASEYAELRREYKEACQKRQEQLSRKPYHSDRVIVPTTPGRPIRDAKWWEKK